MVNDTVDRGVHPYCRRGGAIHRHRGGCAPLLGRGNRYEETINLRTAELVKGHAVSVWWVIFNNPDACDGDCAVEDLFVDDVMAAVQSGGGHSVGGSGKAGLAGHLSEGEVTNEHPAFQGGPGLLDARGAEIHLVVRSHGPVQPGNNHQMYNSFEAGCMDFLPQGVMPEEKGECADVQFAVFK